MKKSDDKIMRAIKASEEFINKCQNKEKYSDYGLTVYGCECRNLEEYKAMLGQDKRKLVDHQRQLYFAI